MSPDQACNDRALRLIGIVMNSNTEQRTDGGIVEQYAIAYIILVQYAERRNSVTDH